MLSFKNSNGKKLSYDYQTIFAKQAEIEKITKDLKFTDKKTIRKSFREFFENIGLAQKNGQITAAQKTEIKKLISLLGFTISEIENRFNIKL